MIAVKQLRSISLPPTGRITAIYLIMRHMLRKFLYIIFVTFLSTAVVYILLTSKRLQMEEKRHVINLKRDYILTADDNVQTMKTKGIGYVALVKNKVNLFKYTKDDAELSVSHKTLLKTFGGKIPIYVHDKADDNMISAHVRQYGTWEEDLLNETGIFMRRQNNVTFVDIGCNIGVYTLFVAKLGHPVVAVDPVAKNLKLLSKSVNDGGLENGVTLVLNAVSDKYQTVTMDIPKDNVGGAHIVSAKETDPGDIAGNTAKTILLDDLLPLIRTSSVFIKLDVEGYEWNVLNGAMDFFQVTDVKGILMEWVHHRHKGSGQNIIDKLAKHGFLPYKGVDMKSVLDVEMYYVWPENVFWIKR